MVLYVSVKPALQRFIASFYKLFLWSITDLFSHVDAAARAVHLGEDVQVLQ